MLWPKSLKRCAKALHLYRPARCVNQHLFRRADLKRQREDAAFFAAFLRKGDLVFDVGANVGNKTRVFLGLGARVVAFEPQADCVTELTARIGSRGDFTIEQCALGAKSGEATLHVQASSGSSSLLESWGNRTIDHVKVPVRTMDEMIRKYGIPQYVKIDVEGYELEVLEGLSRCIPLLSFEYHRDNEADVAKVHTCLRRLERFGPLAINLTPAERCIFHYRGWVDLPTFLNDFPHSFADDFAYRYGDVFVRVGNSGGRQRPER